MDSPKRPIGRQLGHFILVSTRPTSLCLPPWPWLFSNARLATIKEDSYLPRIALLCRNLNRSYKPDFWHLGKVKLSCISSAGNTYQLDCLLTENLNVSMPAGRAVFCVEKFLKFFVFVEILNESNKYTCTFACCGMIVARQKCTVALFFPFSLYFAAAPAPDRWTSFTMEMKVIWYRVLGTTLNYPQQISTSKPKSENAILHLWTDLLKKSLMRCNGAVKWGVCLLRENGRYLTHAQHS